MSRVSGACMSMLALAGLTGLAHAQAPDRYGPSASDDDVSAASPVGSDVLAGAPVRMLSWPGKVSATAATAPARADAPAPRPARTVAYASPQASAPRQAPVFVAAAPAAPAYRAEGELASPAPAPTSAAPHYGLVQAMPRLSGPSPASAAPTIYDDAPAQPARLASRQTSPASPEVQQAQGRQTASVQSGSVQTASVQTASVGTADPEHPGWAPPRHPWSQTGDTSVRFYSLHRQYGVKPDPAPIPPQFFTAAADLSQPAGPEPRTISGAGTAAQAARAVQATEAETSSDPSSSQP